MSRDTSPYIVGDYWLDKRRDGKSPDIWQIARKANRSELYRSTHCKSLDDAKAALDAHVARERAVQRQDATVAEALPMLMTYWDEVGRKAVNHDQTERSIKTFIGFLLQDKAGARAAVADLLPALFERFRIWRMAPHNCDLMWGGEPWTYASDTGVSGATVQRNINDIRAAVYHAERNRRAIGAPHIGDIDQRYKSPSRDRILTIDELARIFWYAKHTPDLFRFVTLQMVTSVRPMAALQFDPRRQFLRDRLIDTQPDEAPQTKKRNAVIPAIRPFRVVLRAWARDGATPVGSRKTAWRIMRRTLGLSDDVLPKTIRYTIATWLHEMEWVPGRQISEMLGHIDGSDGLARTSRIYAKYRPENMGKVVKGLTIIWLTVSRAARVYGADHRLTTVGQGGKLIVVENA